MVLPLIIGAIIAVVSIYEVADAYVTASTGKGIANHITGTESETQQIVDSTDALNQTMEILAQRLEDFWDGAMGVFEAIADAAYAVMQYLDNWGIIVLVMFVVVIVILLAMFYNVGKIRRYR